MIRLLSPTHGLQPNLAHRHCRSLCGWWMLNRRTGTEVADLSPFRLNGDFGGVLGQSDWIADAVGTGIHFTSSNNEGIDCGAVNDFEQITNQVTISCWARWGTPANNDTLCGKSRGAILAYGLKNSGSGDKPKFEIRTGGTNSVEAINGIAQGELAFVVGTYDGANLRVYVNGVLENTAAASGNINYSFTNGFGIGRIRGEANKTFDGDIFDVRVWSRCLAADEILEICRNPWAPFEESKAYLFGTPAGGGTTVTPAPVTGTWSVLPVTTRITHKPNPVSADWIAPSPTTKIRTKPLPIAATWIVPPVQTRLRIKPTPVAGSWLAPTPSVGGSVVVQPAPVGASWIALTPTISLTQRVAAVVANWNAPTPIVGGPVQYAILNRYSLLGTPSLIALRGSDDHRADLNEAP